MLVLPRPARLPLSHCACWQSSLASWWLPSHLLWSPPLIPRGHWGGVLVSLTSHPILAAQLRPLRPPTSIKIAPQALWAGVGVSGWPVSTPIPN